jgi:hypothetical protein
MSVGVFFSSGTQRLRVIRDGSSILRSASVPKPVVFAGEGDRETASGCSGDQ